MNENKKKRKKKTQLDCLADVLDWGGKKKKANMKLGKLQWQVQVRLYSFSQDAVLF